jgi:hypothetical protein
VYIQTQVGLESFIFLKFVLSGTHAMIICTPVAKLEDKKKDIFGTSDLGQTIPS